MKFIIVFAALFAVALAVALAVPTGVDILRSDSDVGPESYSFE